MHDRAGINHARTTAVHSHATEETPGQPKRRISGALFAFRFLNAETLAALDRDDINHMAAELKPDSNAGPIAAALEACFSIPVKPDDMMYLSLVMTRIEERADAGTHAGLNHIIIGKFMDPTQDKWRPFQLAYNLEEMHGIFRPVASRE